MAEQDFSPDGYRALIAAFQARGYEVRGFAEAEPDQRHLVLRHDVDVDLGAAVRLAEIERERGVRSHYFVLLVSNFYNAHAPDSRRHLRRIADLGHRIGLHFDRAAYEEDEIEDAAARECDLLEALTGQAVDMISLHRPMQTLIGSAKPLAGRPHTYQPRFVKEMGYCADSRGTWRYGHPLAQPAVQQGRALHLLTHPIWWSGAAIRPDERLYAFLASRLVHLDRSLAENCDIHQAGHVEVTVREKS